MGETSILSTCIPRPCCSYLVIYRRENPKLVDMNRFEITLNIRGTCSLREMMMINGMKVKMKSKKAPTEPDVDFCIMTERRKMNMMMEIPYTRRRRKTIHGALKGSRFPKQRIRVRMMASRRTMRNMTKKLENHMMPELIPIT